MNSLQVGAEDIFVVHRSRNKRVLLNFKANIISVDSSLLYNGISCINKMFFGRTVMMI